MPLTQVLYRTYRDGHGWLKYNGKHCEVLWPDYSRIQPHAAGCFSLRLSLSYCFHWKQSENIYCHVICVFNELLYCGSPLPWYKLAYRAFGMHHVRHLSTHHARDTDHWGLKCKKNRQICIVINGDFNADITTSEMTHGTNSTTPPACACL